MPEKTEKKAEQPKGFIAYADFTYGDKLYKAGDIFAPPAGLARDASFDEFRMLEKKNVQPGQQIGTAFTNPRGARVVLPVQEA